MPYDRSKLAELLRKIVSNAKTGDVEPLGNERRYHLLPGEGISISAASADGETAFQWTMPKSAGPSVAVVNEGVDAIDSFVEECLNDSEIAHAVGESGVRSGIDLFLRRWALDQSLNITPDFVRFEILKPLKESIRSWEVILPLFNLIVDEPQLFGEFSILPKDAVDAKAEAFWAKHDYFGNTEEEKEQQREISRVSARAFTTRAKTYIRFEARVHADLILNYSIAQAAYYLNFLRCYCHILYHSDDHAIFGLPTEVSSSESCYWAMDHGDRHCMNSSRNISGALIPFYLNSDALASLRSNSHLEELIALINKPPTERSTLEIALVQAMQSWGRTMLSFSSDDLLLGSTIMLERMLIKDGEQSTTDRFAERLTLYLGKDLESRKRIMFEAKRLYDIRSKIVHAAYTGVSRRDAQIVERWAATVTMETLGRKDRPKTHAEFCQQLEDLKLSY